jgi:hypothetical protein
MKSLIDNNHWKKDRQKLNALLIWYFQERIDFWISWEKKMYFLEVFKTFSKNEQKEYLKFVVNLIQWNYWDETTFQNLLKNMRHIDKVEVYSWIRNACYK